MRLKCPKCLGDVYVQIGDAPAGMPSLPVPRIHRNELNSTHDEPEPAEKNQLDSRRGIVNASINPAQSTVQTLGRLKIWLPIGCAVVAVSIIALVLNWRSSVDAPSEQEQVPLNAQAEIILRKSKRAEILQLSFNHACANLDLQTRAHCADFDSDTVAVYFPEIECEGRVNYSGDQMSSVAFRIPTRVLLDEKVESGAQPLRDFKNVFLMTFMLMCADHDEDLKTAHTLSSWIDAEPQTWFSGARIRTFGTSIVVGTLNKGDDSQFYAKVDTPDEEFEGALQSTTSERVEAIRKAKAANTWPHLQAALKGIDGYCVTPNLGAATAGRISIGDSMLKVAEVLGIDGSETTNLGGMFQVKWQNETGMILLTFEGGRVSQKMSL